MAGGRPTKYNKEILDKTKAYINNYEQYDHAFPSIVGLAYILDLNKQTIFDWEKQPDKKQFSDMLEKIKEKQELIAWKKGLTGDYNANLVKLLLTKHGYNDKTEVDSKTSDGSMSPNNDVTSKALSMLTTEQLQQLQKDIKNG